MGTKLTKVASARRAVAAVTTAGNERSHEVVSRLDRRDRWPDSLNYTGTLVACAERHRTGRSADDVVNVAGAQPTGCVFHQNLVVLGLVEVDFDNPVATRTLE
jgi:hypothetical protein